MDEKALTKTDKVDEKVTLLADGKEFICCKEKLITCSDYFQAMFSNNFREKDKDTIKLEDIDGESLQILVEFAETGCYNIPNDVTLNLLQTSSMLQFPTIQLACEKEVIGSLSCENCLDVYAVTSTIGLLSISKSARMVALWNFRKITSTLKYLQLSFDELIEYLTDPSLYTGINGEWMVWEAIVAWIQFNESERMSHIKGLLCCLDFKLLTKDDIANMLFYNIVSENDQVVQILENMRRYKLQFIPTYNDANDSEIDATNTMDDIGSNNSEIDVSNTACDDIEEKSCDKSLVSEMISSDNVCDNGKVETDINLPDSVQFYLNNLTRKPKLSPSVVGFKRTNHNKPTKAKTSDDEDDTVVFKRTFDFVPVLYVYDQHSGKIHEELPLSKLCHGPVVCSGFQVCSVGPSIYLLGGEFQYGNGNWNLSLWRYSTATKRWIIENSLPAPRRHHMVAVVDNVIYLLGGFGKYRVVQNTVISYDTESGEWSSCPDMPHSVSQGAACSFNGRLMLFTQEMQLLTYYPTRRKWSAIPLRSPSKHGYRAAVPCGNFVYLVDNCTYSIYQYSPEKHTVIEFGKFLSPPINVSIVDSKMYNFTHDDSDNHIIELLDIEDALKLSSRINKKENDSSCISAAVGKNSISETIKSREIWRENDDGDHIFTTKYPADPTFSLGCFPLLKI